MNATATIAYTSSTDQDNRDRVARVAAAGRVQRSRIVAEYRATVEQARREAIVDQYLKDARTAGAERIGFKICDEMGKFRMVLAVEDARGTLVHYCNADMEAWGIRADGEYVAIW